MEPKDMPRPQGFTKGIRYFIGAVALSHAVAFASVWVQWRGLIGPEGILPAGQFLQAAHEQLGARAWYDVPTLCWVFGTGHFIDFLCGAGILLASLVFLGFAQAPCLALLWVCYLSLVSVGQIFLDFQWDALLLECTLVAIWLVPWTLRRSQRDYEPPRLARYLAWWLLFRLMFLSGIVKLASGDPVWRNLTALVFHYQTQPLPTPLAWYAHQFPVWMQKASCAVMFAVELGAPFLIPGPRPIRRAAALAMVGLQGLIALTGNYTFFNILSVGLCLTCLDDDWWLRLGRSLPVRPVQSGAETPAPARRRLVALRCFAAFYVGVTFFEGMTSLSRRAAQSYLVHCIEEVVGPFQTLNNYGLFAVMTVERPELIFEGSDDGRDWREYGFPYKPGDLNRGPRWVAPHQPRLDWQLWFAALGPPDNAPWVATFCLRLLMNDREVTALLSHNPFPDHAPRYIRVVRYIYEFTDSTERTRTGNWWRRTPVDFYIQPVTLPAVAP